jgi:hypothetical protein
MHKAMELRKANRYQLCGPVLFMWAHQDGKPQNGKGLTRDISPFGVYVITNRLPQVGARVQMEILLPTLTEKGSGMQLTGEGMVLRCEHSDSGDSPNAGFAASVQFYPETSGVVLSRLKGSGKVDRS